VGNGELSPFSFILVHTFTKRGEKKIKIGNNETKQKRQHKIS
jgi:hypothetical protein